MTVPDNGSSELKDFVDSEGKTCEDRCGAIPGCIGYSIVHSGTACYLHVWATDAGAAGLPWRCQWQPGDQYSPVLEINSVYVDTFGQQVCYIKTK